MKPVIALCIVIGVIILLGIIVSREKYRFLKGMYLPAQGGHHAEPNEDCLQFPGVRQCVMTDGTSGTCVMGGLCVASMLDDLNLENLEIRKPYCPGPTFKEGCGRFCACQKMKGGSFNTTACLQNCESWFSPL